MWPFSYSRCAMRIVRAEVKCSLRPASCCSVDVINGGYGRRVYGFSSTALTVISAPVSDSANAWAVCLSTTSASPFNRPRSSKSRPWATRFPPRATSFASNWVVSPCLGCNVAVRSQYCAAMNAIRSRSRSTITLVATDCTRPADRRGMTFFHSTGETS